MIKAAVAGEPQVQTGFKIQEEEQDAPGDDLYRWFWIRQKR